MLGEHVLEYAGDGFELGQLLVIKSLFACGKRFDGHFEAMHLIQVGDDFADWLPAPGIKELFVVAAVPLGESSFPGDVVERHGVGDGAVTVKEVSAKLSSGQFKIHGSDGTPCGMM